MADNAHIETYLMEYVIVSDIEGNPVSSFMRDRIFKRLPKYRWINPVHEQLTVDLSTSIYANIEGLQVTHVPEKPIQLSADRNVTILRHELEKAKFRRDDFMFFLARDLLLTHNKEEAFKLALF